LTGGFFAAGYRAHSTDCISYPRVAEEIQRMHKINGEVYGRWINTEVYGR
jgi:hypothetical protein